MAPNTFKVLVAEDEALIAMALEDTLAELGHEVCWMARTGPEALELARQHRPDLVTMDGILAEGTSGLVAAAAISSTLGIPVIMVSGTVGRREAILVGASAAVPKPFTPEQIEAAVRNATNLGPMDRRALTH